MNHTVAWAIIGAVVAGLVIAAFTIEDFAEALGFTVLIGLGCLVLSIAIVTVIKP